MAAGEKLFHEMRREFFDCKDPRIQFITTSNYGKLNTDLRTEFEFVVEPR